METYIGYAVAALVVAGIGYFIYTRVNKDRNSGSGPGGNGKYPGQKHK